MRKFEKISFEQFKLDVKDDINLYNSYLLPKRGTKNSAGYDFFALFDCTIKPGEIMKIPTGVKSCFKEDEVLFLIVRSSMGFKWNVRMCNQVGVIDSDYYNNIDNEGHIWIKLQNEGDKNYNVKKGEAIIQGIFLKYLMTDDDNTSSIRTSGIGSTTKKER